MLDAMLKRCKQCGEYKPLDNYRSYYTSNGRYTKCKDCERINSREKYLNSKAKLNDKELDELNKIHMLWDMQRGEGLTPPRSRNNINLDSMLARYDKPDVPAELEALLTLEFDQDPEFYYDLYDEQLAPKYRPVIGMDPDTLMPIYDETHKETLRKILQRIDDYDQEYYNYKED